MLSRLLISLYSKFNKKSVVISPQESFFTCSDQFMNENLEFVIKNVESFIFDNDYMEEIDNFIETIYRLKINESQNIFYQYNYNSNSIVCNMELTYNKPEENDLIYHKIICINSIINCTLVERNFYNNNNIILLEQYLKDIKMRVNIMLTFGKKSNRKKYKRIGKIINI